MNNLKSIIIFIMIFSLVSSVNNLAVSQQSYPQTQTKQEKTQVDEIETTSVSQFSSKSSLLDELLPQRSFSTRGIKS